MLAFFCQITFFYRSGRALVPFKIIERRKEVTGLQFSCSDNLAKEPFKAPVLGPFTNFMANEDI